MKDVHVSMVSAANSTSTRTVPLLAILQHIKGGRWRQEVGRIRHLYNSELKRTDSHKEAKKAVEHLKKNLPGVMWSGTFRNREKPVPDKLITHSGRLCGDIDADALDGKDRQEIKTKLQTSPYAEAVFRSPTAGVKVIVKVPADASQHEGSFRAVRQHILALAGVQIDESGSDIGRLCFVTDDPEAYFNLDAQEITPLPPLPKPEPAQTGVADLALRQREAVGLLGQVFDWQSETHGFLTCPGKHLHTTGDAERDCEIHLDGAPTIHCFHNHCREILESINHELRSRIGKAECANTPPPREGKDEQPSYPSRNAETAREFQAETKSADAAHEEKCDELTSLTSLGAEKETLVSGDFPLDALNPTIKTIVEQSAETYQINPALPAMASVSVLSGAIGKGPTVIGAVSGRRTHLNVYVVPGAPKSYGKNAASTLARPLQNASNEIANVFRSQEKPRLIAEQQIKQERAKSLIKECAKGPDGKSHELIKIAERLLEIERLLSWPPTYTVGNCTSAALTEILKRNDEMIFSFSPEAGELVRIALGKFNKDQAADFDLYLSGYTVESARETRISRGDSGDVVPCITVLWFCQPFLLRELFANEEALERGLTARVLPFIVDHDGDIPEDDGVLRCVSAKAEQNWNSIIRGALLLRKSPLEIRCSEGAREVFRAFHNEAVRLRNGQYRDIEGELGRWRENAIKAAGGQWVADAIVKRKSTDDLVLTPDQAQRGVDIARWSHLHSIAMLRRGMVERRWQRVERLCDLLVRYNGSVTLRILRDNHGFAPDEVKALSAEYSNRIQVKVVKQTTGRPSEVLMFARKR